ncbi:P-loop containing nucleoside triphosphate hydrolase protein, partial [Ochromonadaceae sp. CCMP2298]
MGRKIFIADATEVWLPAEVVYDDSGQEIIKIDQRPPVRLSNLPVDYCFLLQNDNIDPLGFDDISQMTHLHEPSILDNLRRRFQQQFPYTYVHDICIAVNPYKWLDIYSNELRQQYINQPRSALPPHVYSISSASFKDLRDRGLDQ